MYNTFKFGMKSNEPSSKDGLSPLSFRGAMLSECSRADVSIEECINSLKRKVREITVGVWHK